MPNVRIGPLLQSAVLALSSMTVAHASCVVTGGGPIVDGAEVICSGTTLGSVVAPDANGVTVTVAAGATLDAGGAARAIQLGNGANVTVSAGALVVGTPGAVDPVVSVGSNSIVSVAGIVRTLGPGRTVAAFFNSVVSVSGQLDGDFGGDPAIYFIQSGATTGNAFAPTYLSSAGTVASVQMAVPFYLESELYNEAGGNIRSGVVYTAETLLAGIFVFSNIDNTVVNRGHIGAHANGYAIQSANHILSDLQFSNELNAVVEGDVEILRAFEVGRGTGTNLGIIDGRVVLPVPVTDAYGNGFGLPQHFDNHGLVHSIDISSGEFVQAADASFASNGSLRVAGNSSIFLWGPFTGGPPPDDDFFGTLTLAGAQQTGCLQGSSATQTVGGVVNLQAMSTLTVSPVVAQSCQFDGVLVGAGKLLKTGTGTQVLGARALPQFWTAPRPPTSFSGGTSVVAGTLASIASDAFGTGPVSVDGANARIRIDADNLVIANAFAFNAMTVLDSNGFDVTLEGASSGSVLVQKTGAGTLRWNGARAHTGMTLINGGVLRLNDSIAGPVTVAGSGTLAGSATLAGGLNVLSGGRMLFAIDGGTHDRFVAPTASLSGGTLQLDLIAPAPIGSTIELVDVSGPAAVNGIFANVAEGGFLHDGDTGYRLSYVGGDGNDITLTALRVPLPPQNLVATPGNAQLSLSFTPPAANGSGTVTGYRAQCMPGNVSADAPQSPIVVSGLNNGVAYTCNVRTLAAVGPSAASVGVIATPVSIASAPTGVVVTPGDASFSVAFSPPVDNGGSPVSTFRLACEPGALIVTGASSPLGFTGLVNGNAYNCALAAVTEVGIGQASLFSATPRTVPGVPLNLSGIGYNGEIRFRFDPPTFDGGAPITDYRVRCSPGATRVVNGPASPLTLTGQNNGQSLSCRVRATNVAGNSAESADIVVAARAVPSEVRNAFVVDSDAAAAIAFDAPSLGAPILDYSATCEPGSLVFTQTLSPLVAMPLVNNTQYDCSVTARNALGSGPPVSVQLRPSTRIFGDDFE